MKDSAGARPDIKEMTFPEILLEKQSGIGLQGDYIQARCFWQQGETKRPQGIQVSQGGSKRASKLNLPMFSREQ
jgi:hypothetical protein